MASPMLSTGIFSSPLLQSALCRLSSCLDKQPPSSSHVLGEELARLRQSLITITEKLPINVDSAHGSIDFQTQLKDATYATDDLVDELAYIFLRQEADAIAEPDTTENQTPVGETSASKYKGFQIDEEDATDQPTGGSPLPLPGDVDGSGALKAQPDGDVNPMLESPGLVTGNGGAADQESGGSLQATPGDFHSSKKKPRSRLSIYNCFCGLRSRVIKQSGGGSSRMAEYQPAGGPLELAQGRDDDIHNGDRGYTYTDQNIIPLSDLINIKAKHIATSDALARSQLWGRRSSDYDNSDHRLNQLIGRSSGNTPISQGSMDVNDLHHSGTNRDMPSKVLQDICNEVTIAKRINKMVEQLNCFAAHLEEYATNHLHPADVDLILPDAIRCNAATSSDLKKREVYSREGEGEQLVKMLLESDDEEDVSIIPILGAAGVGKTTLAYAVYSDERVVKHFHAREWVCASDSFDMMRAGGELEESLWLSGPLDEVQLLELLDRNVKPQLKEKRFLLVLDDVRSIEWSRLFAAKGTGAKGSKILVTARDERVVDEEGKRSKMVLGGLNEDETWSLLKRYAFGEEDPSEHPKLEIIGREITEKLKGSPLAAKMVGGALREKLDDHHWANILRSRLWGSDDNPCNIMPCLRLTYEFLAPHLQYCFAYCSVFPKGYPFDADKLVHIWMAQGLIQTTNTDTRIEDIGRHYFDQLSSRCFFELPAYTKSYWRAKYYLMHDLLHDLASSVCLDECFVCEGYEPERIPHLVRHLSVSQWSSTGIIPHEFKWSDLRTLIINCMHNTEFELLRRVRVLDLSHSYMTRLPDAIGHLIHLKYLHLSGNVIDSLPESLCNLYHLQSLKVHSRCRRLPRGITKLINLRHLIASDAAISSIAGIGKLTCLQELKEFNVRRALGHDIAQLKSMKELRGQLCINYLDRVWGEKEAIEACLRDKSQLKTLQLKWTRWQREHRPDVHDEVLESLHPPSNLDAIEIHWYKGLSSPSWLAELSIQNLKSIYLRGCEKWQRIPPLGALPCLEVLRIEEMDVTVNGVDEPIEMFPSLKELQLTASSVSFVGMPVPAAEPNVKFFPCLRKLCVQNCNKVKGFPRISYLKTLEELDIKRSPDLDAVLPGVLKDLTSLTTLKLSQLQLTSFPGNVTQWLETLEIDSCEKLTTWLAEEEECGPSSLISLSISNTTLPRGPILKKYLTSLQELRIDRCSNLRSFTVEQCNWLEELVLLRKLSITDCNNLKYLPRELHGLPCLEELAIRGCSNIKSLPLRLPITLRRLEIWNNPKLTAPWQDERAPDWVKRIPFRYLT